MLYWEKRCCLELYSWGGWSVDYHWLTVCRVWNKQLLVVMPKPGVSWCVGVNAREYRCSTERQGLSSGDERCFKLRVYRCFRFHAGLVQQLWIGAGHVGSFSSGPVCLHVWCPGIQSSKHAVRITAPRSSGLFWSCWTHSPGLWGRFNSRWARLTC